MTKYLVFIQDKESGAWLEELPQHTHSAKAAITAHLKANPNDPPGGGTYVAVPARSWRPVTVKVETKTALRFS